MRPILFSLALLLGCGADSGPGGPNGDPPPPPPAGGYFVSPDGSDAAGDGSEVSPWRTISHAVASLPAAGGVTVWLADGTYADANSVERGFEDWVELRARNPYGAVLTNLADGRSVLYVGHQGPVRLRLRGLVLTNAGTSGNPCASPAGHLVQLTNVSDIEFVDCVFQANDRMPRCNDVIKLNLDDARFFPTGIRFEGNWFSSPPAVEGREMIDVFEPGELDLVANVFVSDRGRAGAGGPFVRVWGEWGSTTARTPRYRVERNVFLGYEGRADGAFLEFGGEGAPIPEASDVLVENNLFVGDSGAPMRAPIVLRGVQRALVRANTFVGALPSVGFALALGADGANPPSREVRFEGNLLDATAGALEGPWISVFGPVDEPSLVVGPNLVHGGGGGVPDGLASGEGTSPTLGDPRLPSPFTPTTSRFRVDLGRFESGATTIAAEHARLAQAYAALGSASAARDAAGGISMPPTDILGRARDSIADFGCVEAR